MTKKVKKKSPEKGLNPDARLPPLGLPSIEEMRKQLGERMKTLPPSGSLPIKQGQQIKTPLIEQDIELDPPGEGPNRLSRTAQRVWSTLWGRSPQGPRRLRCDDNGNLYTRPVDMSKTTWVWVIHDVSNGGDTVFSLGGVMNYVRIYTQFQRHFVKFITPNNAAVNALVINPTETDGINFYGSWEGFCTCKSLLISGLDDATVKSLIVIGLKLNQ